jgi:hypothetical protein
LFLLALVLSGLFPERMTALHKAIIREPVRSGALGVGSYIGAVVLIIALTITVLGIPAAVVLAFGMPIATYVGLAACATVIGAAIPSEKLSDRPILRLASGVGVLFVGSLVPFVGPICRPNDDERYACDFKKDVYERLSHVYDIVSAIDDDNYVLAMWRSIPGLEVVATSYSSRAATNWRSYGVGATTAQDNRFDWEIYEPEDEEILEYEREVSKLKRRQPGQRHGWEDWESDAGMDVWCNKCQHPWFEHDITGCTANALCSCDG